jgi:molybdopterin-containing oxidoreductase family molybdopterin binding subunit
MSDQAGVSRRTVLLSAGTAAGALGLGGTSLLQSLDSGQRTHAVEAFLDENEVLHGYCEPNCRGKCALDVHVRDGRIRKIEPKIQDNEEYKRACTLGLSHAQRAYNPTRLQYPMKRTDWSPGDPNPTGRGPEAEFERIEWDEALDYVADEMDRVREEYDPQSVYFELGSGGGGINGTVYSRLAGLFGGTMKSWSIDINVGLGFRRITGGGYFNTPTNQATDIENANTIVIWGGNIFESRFQMDASKVLNAKANGAKIVVVDPAYNTTTSKADLWLPIKPGKDPYLALGMINTVFEEGYLDEEFLRERTLGPALVREDGSLLKTADVLEDGDDETPVALDEATGEPVALTPETYGEYALFGEHEVAGETVTTGLTKIREAAADYAPEEIEDLVGIDAENIRTTVRWLGTRGPGGILTGLGVDRYVYGHIFGQTYAILLALLGQYGESGCVTGGITQGNGYNSDYGVPEDAPGSRYLQQKGILSAMEGDDEHPIKAMYVQSSNFTANQMPDRQRWLDALENVDMVAVADIQHTPNVQRADIILPASHWMEREDVTGTWTHPHVRYREPAHDPLWEAKSDHWMLVRLAERLGYGEHFDRDRETTIRKILDAEDRFTFEELREKGSIYIDTPEVIWQGEFNTPSGRLEIYDEDAPSEGDTSLEVPVPMESRTAEDHELAEEYPLTFLQKHSRWRIHSQFGRMPSLRQVEPEPVADIHPSDAEERGIDDGEYVRVYNDRGEVVVKARYNEGYRPGMVNINQGWWEDDYVRGHHNDLTHTDVSDAIENFAFYDTRVDVEPAPDDVDTSQYTDPKRAAWLDGFPDGGDS